MNPHTMSLARSRLRLLAEIHAANAAKPQE